MNSSDLAIEATEFCTESLKDLFRDFLKTAKLPLILSKKYDAVVDMWVKLHLTSTILSNSTSSCDSDRHSLAACIEMIHNSSQFDLLSLNPNDIVVEIDSCLLDWARTEWGHKVESIYLESKDDLDAVSFEMIRVKDNFLAVELYYRLTAEEQSFNQISWEYGQGPEKKHAGRFNDRRLKDLPEGLPRLLRKLKPNEVSKPRLFGNYYTILKLIGFRSAQYDLDMQNYLLKARLTRFVSEVRECLAKP